jgi:hypothetical protein
MAKSVPSISIIADLVANRSRDLPPAEPWAKSSNHSCNYNTFNNILDFSSQRLRENYEVEPGSPATFCSLHWRETRERPKILRFLANPHPGACDYMLPHGRAPGPCMVQIWTHGGYDPPQAV